LSRSSSFFSSENYKIRNFSCLFSATKQRTNSKQQQIQRRTEYLKQRGQWSYPDRSPRCQSDSSRARKFRAPWRAQWTSQSPSSDSIYSVSLHSPIPLPPQPPTPFPKPKRYRHRFRHPVNFISTWNLEVAIPWKKTQLLFVTIIFRFQRIKKNNVTKITQSYITSKFDVIQERKIFGFYFLYIPIQKKLNKCTIKYVKLTYDLTN
jgi:hypothetical protein